jgi:hypothetical protein
MTRGEILSALSFGPEAMPVDHRDLLWQALVEINAQIFERFNTVCRTELTSDSSTPKVLNLPERYSLRSSTKQAETKSPQSSRKMKQEVSPLLSETSSRSHRSPLRSKTQTRSRNPKRKAKR